jgi:hypothetical protein
VEHVFVAARFLIIGPAVVGNRTLKSVTQELVELLKRLAEVPSVVVNHSILNEAAGRLRPAFQSPNSQLTRTGAASATPVWCGA